MYKTSNQPLPFSMDPDRLRNKIILNSAVGISIELIFHIVMASA